MPEEPRARLGPNSYGKSRVRVMKVVRDDGRHDVRELSVDIALSGDFEAVHRGDNALCLPTDTMKNTVYAMAKERAISAIESFALDLARHFVGSHPPVGSARVAVCESPWRRVHTPAGPRPHTFIREGTETADCIVRVDRSGGESVEGGLGGLMIMNTTASAFSGFARDRFTTLKETRDRIMCTSVTASWRYARGVNPDFLAARARIREALVRTFADHVSESVQQTLFDMGRSALAAESAISQIWLSLPNKHCLLVDLSPFGLANPNEVFVPTDEPHGLIEATVER